MDMELLLVSRHVGGEWIFGFTSDLVVPEIPLVRYLKILSLDCSIKYYIDRRGFKHPVYAEKAMMATWRKEEN